MTGIQAIIVVLIRLWAAGNAMGVIANAGFVIWTASNEESFGYSAVLLAQLSIWVLVGGLAWFGAPWLARQIKIPNQSVSLNIDAPVLVAIGSFLIGIFYLAQYLPPILLDWARWLIHRAGETAIEQAQHGAGPWGIVQWQNFISNCSIVVVASFMAFRPSYLARMFSWLRATGHSRIEKAGE